MLSDVFWKSVYEFYIVYDSLPTEVHLANLSCWWNSRRVYITVTPYCVVIIHVVLKHCLFKLYVSKVNYTAGFVQCIYNGQSLEW